MTRKIATPRTVISTSIKYDLYNRVIELRKYNLSMPDIIEVGIETIEAQIKKGGTFARD